MKLKKLALPLLLGSLLLTGCGGKKGTTTSSSESSGKEYKIKVYDIDDELIFEYEENGYKGKDTLSKLIKKVAPSYELGNKGFKSIAGQIEDKEFYSAFYRNGKKVDAYEQKVYDGDLIEIKMESNQYRLDKLSRIIYHYAKTTMKDLLAQDDTYMGSNYWTYMACAMMRQQGYTHDLFSITPSTKLFNSLLGVDFSTFDETKAQYGKYYYTMKGLGYDIPNTFVTAYTTYIENISTTYSAYSEYYIPFNIGPSYALKITSSNLTELVKSDYIADTSYYIDGLAYQLTAESLFVDYVVSKKYGPLTLSDKGNATSNALLLLPYCAQGMANGKVPDFVDSIIEDYYDEELQLIKVNKTDEGVEFSTNQIYASLMAYKCVVDNNKKVNLFA